MKKILSILLTISGIIFISSDCYAPAIGSGIIGPSVSFTGIPQVSANTVTGNTGYFTNLYINGVTSGTVYLELSGGNANQNINIGIYDFSADTLYATGVGPSIFNDNISVIGRVSGNTVYADNTIGCNGTVTGNTATFSPDQDTTHTFGKWKFGYDSVNPDYAFLAHYNMFNANMFALMQENDGDTWINSANNHYIMFSENGSFFARFRNNEFNLHTTPIILGDAWGSEDIEIRRITDRYLDISSDYGQITFAVEGQITSNTVSFNTIRSSVIYSEDNIGSDGIVTGNTVSGNTIYTAKNIQGMPHYLRFTIVDPLSVQTETALICLVPKLDASITVTNLEVTLDAAANEVAGDIKRADTFIGLANATVINDFDTTSGVRSDSTITSGAVAAGKCIYLSFDSAPSTNIHNMNVDITYDYN